MKKLSVLLLVFVSVMAMSLSACTSKVEFKVSFIVDNEVYATVTTNGDETIKMPTNPTKEDFIFDGWYWDNDIWQRPFTAESLLHEKLTSDMSVYAKWLEEDVTKRSYTVTFNSMGGSAVEKMEVVYGHLITEPQKPTKTGYVFAGWYSDAGTMEIWDFDADTVTEDITLFAKWVDEKDATGCEILLANGFSIEGNTLSIKVPNAQEYFALSDAITVSPYANWTVTSDIAGKNEIPSATVSLNVGDNTYYINVVSGNNSNKKQYTVNIRRREIYSVTYRFENGQNDETVSIEEDSKLENRTPEDKQGYTFEGWLIDDELWNFESDVVIESITLVAKWNANEYNVTLDSREGSVVENQQVTYDATFNFPVPTKNGYTFLGWEEEDGTLLTNAQGAGLDIWKNTSTELMLYAKWELNTYTITYHGITDHGPIRKELVHSNTTQYSVELDDINLSAPTSAGYEFVNWYEDAECCTPIETIDTARAENLDLYAKFTVVSYTAKFFANDEQVGEDVAFTVETDSLTEPSVPNKMGYTGAWADYTIGAQDLVINAVYTAIVYDIEYLETKDADNSNRTTYTIEDNDITLLDISAVGYDFLGWFEDGQKVDKISGGSTGKRTFTAHWSTIEYTLKLEYDEGMLKYADGDSNPEKFNIESNFELKGLETYTIGYRFLGWFTEKNNGDGEQVTAIKPGRHEDLTLYAHYGLEEYTITYHNVDGVTNTNTTTYTVLSEEFTIDDVSKNGYSFDGWFSDADCQTQADTTIETGSHGNLNFYAKWTPIKYTLEFQLLGGNYEGEGNKNSYTIEDSFMFVEPKYAGYRFDGWFTLADGGEKQTGIVEGTIGNKTFYAHWTRVTTLHFDSKNGSHVEDMLVPAGDAIFAPQAPTRDYYKFEYWCSDEACEQEFIFDEMPENDQTLYAKWTPIEYVIHYVLYDGENNVDNPETYNVESHVILSDPTKTGYSFNAWYRNAQFTGDPVAEIAVGSHDEITLYASFSINQYTMSFNTHDGTTIDDITQNYDTLITPPSNPAKTGYSFAGWYKDAEYQEKYTIDRMPAENLTLHAKWNLVEYEIHYNLNNGDNNELNPETYNIETGATFYEPTKNGYNFKGWYSDSGMEDQIESIPVGSHGIKEVYAKWEAIEYDIIYVIPDGAVNSNIAKYSIETDITLLEDGKLLGHKFDGWFKEQSYTTKVTQIGGGETGVLTLYGKFTPNKYTIWLDGNEEGTATVSFNTMGGNENYPEQNITENQGLKYPGNPTKEGFLFGGWYANSECEGTLYDFTAQVGGNITLYAKWISYGNANAINVGDSSTITLNGKTEIIYRFVPVVSGNISITTQGNIDTFGALFLGEKLLKQNDDDGDGENFLIVYNVTAGQLYEIRVRAFSSSANGEVTLSVSGKTTGPDGGCTLAKFDSSSVTFGDNFDLPVRTGERLQKFLGWQDANGVMYTDENGHSVRTWDKGEDTVLYSKWEKMEYTVTFNTAGGENVNDTNSIKLEYGSRLDLSQYTPIRANFTFAGWYLNTSDPEPYNATTMPDHNITLYAKWITFALGSIKYDEDKKAVSVNDEITAELFDAICLDTDGKPAIFTVTISGTQSIGATIAIRLTATSGGKNKVVTISGVKVYGNPTISVTDTSKDYINLTDGLNGDWFGASGLDCFGEPTQIVVRIEEPYAAGDIVTVYIDSIDAAGNVITFSIDNIKLYGKPIIEVEHENLSSELGLSVEQLSAVAEDSFGNSLDVSVEKVISGILNADEYTYLTSTSYNYQYFTAINSGTYTLKYKNGSSSGRTYLMVYCVTTGATVSSDSYVSNTSYSSKTIRVTAGYEYYIRTYAYGSIYTTDFSMCLTSPSYTIDGAFKGEVMVVLFSEDSHGNINRVTLPINMFSSPIIEEPLNVEFRVTDEITVKNLGISATDCFGTELEILLTLSNGSQSAGETMTWVASVTDVAGNVTERVIKVKIYGSPQITYDREGLSIGKDVTAFPSVTVSFNLNYSNATGVLKPQTIFSGESLVYPEIPVREGYVFRGWFEEKECNNIFDFSQQLNESITVYAGWTQTETTYYKLAIIDTVENYNSSSNALSLGIGKSSSDYLYKYFTIYNDGTYTFYYRKGKIHSLTSGGQQVFSVYNCTTQKYLKNATICTSDNYSSFSFQAKAGDVIRIMSYGSPATSTSSGDTKITDYASPSVYITGNTYPLAGGTMYADSSNLLMGGAEIFNAVAKDSFGKELDVVVTYKSGTVAVGNYVVFTFTAIDHLGNKSTIDTAPLGIYDANDIKIQYSSGASDLIKKTSKGEEFLASATDTFGNLCDITLEIVDGELEGGQIVSFYIVAIDKAGNKARSELITGIKVYDIPTVELTDESQGYTITEDGEISFLFRVYDSFGEELYAEITTNDVIVGGEYITVEVTATDDAGNVLIYSHKIFVMPVETGTYVELYVNENNIEQVYIPDVSEYTLTVPQALDGMVFYGWTSTPMPKNETIYFTDAQGEGLVPLSENKYVRMYAIWLPENYTPITTLSELQNISASNNYILLNDIDCQNQSFIITAEFSGVFDGNGKVLKNLILKTYSQGSLSISRYGGLFAKTASTAVIRNLGLESPTFRYSFNYASSPSNYSYNEYIGGLVGYNMGLIENCYINNATFTLTAPNVGGLVGSNSGGSIRNCYITGTITGTASLYNTTCTIKNLSENGSYSRGWSNYGGVSVRLSAICAANSGNIQNVYSNMTLSASATLGNVIISETGVKNTGGMTQTTESVAFVTASIYGICGLNYGKIENSFSASTGTATATFTGSISGTQSHWTNVQVSRSSEEGIISSNRDGSVKNIYYVSNTLTQTDIKSVTASEAKLEEFIYNTLLWDKTIWLLSDSSYPILIIEK